MTAKKDNRIGQKHPDLEDVLRELTAIRAGMVADPAILLQRLQRVHPNYRDSARNLIHYLSLRRHDLRPLQLRLAALGLSSLGRVESHVLATVDAVPGTALHYERARGGPRQWLPSPPPERRPPPPRGSAHPDP